MGDTRIAKNIDPKLVPSWALTALDVLRMARHKGFLVGGFVRDGLLGRPCHDVDVTTDAPWERVRDVFQARGYSVVETGAKHGTVTVFIEGQPVEITTFRTEGRYSDGRHPDEVTFVTRVEDDLSRRDFTINAMAWNPERGIVDPFDGRRDLQAGVIRAVGDPRARFEEDGLRILRAVRFASKLGFVVEHATREALLENLDQLDRVSEERIATEYDGIVAGERAVETLRSYAQVVTHVVPELAPMVGFEQHSRWHVHDVWEHCLHALELLDPKASTLVRHATLLHDVGKPATSTRDEMGRGHFYEHEEVGSRIARSIFRRLRWRSLDIDHACLLIRVHDHHIDPSSRGVCRMLARLSRAYAGSDAIAEQLFGELMQVKRADALAHAPSSIPNRMANLDNVERIFQQVVREGQTYRVRDLAISGADVMAAGVPRGPEVGHELRMLLTRVIDGRLPNERGALLDALALDVSSGASR